MRGLPAVFVLVLALSGCASDWSRIEMSTTRPVAAVADCIAQQWSVQYPDVAVAVHPTSMTVKANTKTAMPIQTDVRWTAFGSRVYFSTGHQILVLRDHPAIHAVRACAA